MQQREQSGRVPRPALKRPNRIFFASGNRWRWLAGAGGGALLLLLASCSDARISVTRLAELERPESPPVAPLEPTQLGLTECHPYRVRPGDILSVRMVGLAEDRYAPINIDLRVHDDGRVFPPVVEPVNVDGLELSGVEQALIDAHVPRLVKNLSVFVQLSSAEVTTVLVQGPAAAPGLVRLRENERNVLYALAGAGGFGIAGSGRVHLKPIRPGQTPAVYDLTKSDDVRRVLLAPPLESGDILEVEAANESAIFVSGLVNRAGPILIPPESSLSVLRAVAAAGGLRDYLDVKEATLVRSLSDGEQVQVKLDLGGMIAGRTPDLALKAGDVLHIPYTVDTFAQEWFFRNMLPGPFNVGLHYDPLAQYNAERALRNSGRSSLGDAIRNSLASGVSAAVAQPAAAAIAP